MENTTAKVSCFARAYHYKNHTTHIFSDNIAEKLLGDEYNQIADSMHLHHEIYMSDVRKVARKNGKQ